MSWFRHHVFFGVESWSRALEWSIGVEWSQILTKQKYLLFAHKIMYSMEWSLGAEFWSGVEKKFWNGKSTCSFLIKPCILLYGVESWSRVFDWRIGVEWSQILEWQKKLLFAHKLVYSMESSLGA